MQRLIWCVLLAFAIALALGPVVIPWLKKMKFGQNINELGPATHKVKQGTPQMGGIIFMGAMALVPVILHRPGTSWTYIPVAIICILGFGAIGFVDDFIKIKMKRSLGLTPKQKMIPQLVLSVGLAVWAYFEVGSSLTVPFFGVEWDLGWLFIPFMVFVLVGTVNSANLLDGCDGLLAGCSMIDFITLALITLLMFQGATGAEADGYYNLTLVCGACAGALLGFLRYNSHPANVFMGDSGSFAIGGAIAAVVLCTRLTLLLPLIGICMMTSSLSVIIQVCYFKATHGKRIFKMSPLQHHFELSGMPETHVVSMYYIVTAIVCLVALTGFTA